MVQGIKSQADLMAKDFIQLLLSHRNWNQESFDPMF